MTVIGTAALHTPIYVRYQSDIENEVTRLSTAIGQISALQRYNPRWLAIQLLEGDSDLLIEVQNTSGGAAVLQMLTDSQARLQAIYNEDIDIILTDQRYRFVNTLVRRVLIRPASQRETLSDRVDKIVTHRLLGIPIFLALMWLVFKLTTDVATPYLEWVDAVISGPLTNQMVVLLRLAGLGDSWVESLVVDGIIAGVGGVLVFVPVLMTLYLSLAILEDSGYMARAAFVMDRLMHILGLHGKSFLPMIVGFGCNVPAIYATRTLETEKDRILTGLLVPFMSCSARLPVYVLLAAIFFPAYSGLVVFGLYILGIVAAIGLGFALKNTLFKTKDRVPFIMELPPYRLPTLRGIWTHMWERTASFIRRAGTVIMATSVLIWLLMAIPTGGDGVFAETELDDSAFATVAGVVAPIFTPLGFGSWEASGALVTGFIAKEVVVSTMSQIYGVAEEEEAAEPTTLVEDLGQVITSFVGATIDTLRAVPLIIGIDLTDAEEEGESTGLMRAAQSSFEASSGGHGALAALAFMVFVLLYTPCVAVIAAARQEFGNRWMWFSVVGQLVIAWVAALLVFQGGRLVGWG